MTGTKRFAVSLFAAVASAALLVAPALAAPTGCDAKLKEAKVAVEAAEAEVATLESDLDGALKQQAEVNEAIGPVVDELDAAKQGVQDAQTAATTAAEAKETAEAGLSDAQTADTAAQAALTDATRAKTDAQAAFAQAETDLSAAQAAAETAIAARAKGAAGYFEVRGETDAYKVLTDPNVTTYLSDIHLGAASDATSLDNMVLALQMIEKGNTIREGLGLNAWQVSDTLMAVAMANTDRAAVAWAHPQQFGGVSENLALGHSDPYQGWYYAEKAVFDDAVASGKYPGLDTMSAYQVFAAYPGLYPSVGHYLNVIAPDTLTGFGATGSSGTMGQVMSSGSNVSGKDGAPLGFGRTMTVSAYLTDVQDYKYEIDNKIAARDQAQATLDAAKTALTDAQTALTAAAAAATVAEDALQAAQALQASAAADLLAAQAGLADAQATLATAQAAYDQVSQDLKDAKEAADKAVEAAESALADAEAVLAAAQASYEALQKECSASQGGGAGEGSTGGSGSAGGAGGTGSSGGLAQTGATVGVALLAGISALGGGALLLSRKK